MPGLRPNALDFRRVSRLRIVDAQILLDNDRFNGSVYMAGYAVECVFKAMLLDWTPDARHAKLLEEFRGQLGHNLDALMGTYGSLTGRDIGRAVLKDFNRVRSWTTSLRYEPAGVYNKVEVVGYLKSARSILEWAENHGRLR